MPVPSPLFGWAKTPSGFPIPLCQLRPLQFEIPFRIHDDGLQLVNRSDHSPERAVNKS